MPALLDLFCGAGGASIGYQLAGFDAIVGVDIDRQPSYGFDFVQGDALDYLDAHWMEFDAIHASPPCQGYSHHVSSRSSRWVPTRGKDEPKLIGAVADMLNVIPLPSVIENVMGSADDMADGVVLCGSMFGLPIQRHRLFRPFGFALIPPEHPDCRGRSKAYALDRGWDPRDMTMTGKGRNAGTTERWAEISGLPSWWRQHDVAEAIPPAYTEFVGRFMVAGR